MRSTFIVLLFILVFRTAASSGCGSASCPLTHDRAVHAGIVRLSYIREYIDQDRLRVGTTPAAVGAIPYEHDEVRTINEREVLRLAAGVTDRLSLTAELPFVRRQHAHIHHDEAGDAWESWNFSGLGDARLGGEIDLVTPGDSSSGVLALNLGLTLPTGATDLANAEGETAELTLQPGTGAHSYSVGARYRTSLGSVRTLVGERYADVPFYAGADVQWSGEGPLGWRFGRVITAQMGSSYALGLDARIMLQVNLRTQDYADVGTTGEPRENTGGVWLYASPGLEIDLPGSLSAYAFLQLPGYMDVHGIQQVSCYNVQFGISADVDLNGE